VGRRPGLPRDVLCPEDETPASYFERILKRSLSFSARKLTRASSWQNGRVLDWRHGGPRLAAAAGSGARRLSRGAAVDGRHCRGGGCQLPPPARSTPRGRRRARPTAPVWHPRRRRPKRRRRRRGGGGGARARRRRWSRRQPGAGRRGAALSLCPRRRGGLRPCAPRTADTVVSRYKSGAFALFHISPPRRRRRSSIRKRSAFWRYYSRKSL